ncbi:hypothetical protein CYMTET_54192 [Cymbomonas tetramitiformis]|uniref:Uncharacterized protein n=1 Tax=Cymbomonas tetramitiformis TaxID=36881 RepID=A0AAE0BGQ4_9CHLO|nr:hypothetical protein CYMTET_54192 [Cymbomonas tetramitiformis]
MEPVSLRFKPQDAGTRRSTEQRHTIVDQLSTNAAVNEGRIISELSIGLRRTISLRDFYLNLLKHLVLFWISISVMLAQFRAQNAEVVVSSVADRGLPPKYGLKFMDWLKTMVSY